MKINFSSNDISPQKPIPPFPTPPEKDEDRIPVPPTDIEPEPLTLPTDETHKSPINENPKEPKIYLS